MNALLPQKILCFLIVGSVKYEDSMTKETNLNSLKNIVFGEIPAETTLLRYARITMMLPRDFAKSVQNPCGGNNMPFPYLNQNKVVYDITNISSFCFMYLD